MSKKYGTMTRIMILFHLLTHSSKLQDQTFIEEVGSKQVFILGLGTLCAINSVSNKVNPRMLKQPISSL